MASSVTWISIDTIKTAYHRKNTYIGLPPLLRGIVCTFHAATRVRVPSTPSMLFSISILIVFSCGKDENKEKEEVFKTCLHYIESTYMPLVLRM